MTIEPVTAPITHATTARLGVPGLRIALAGGKANFVVMDVTRDDQIVRGRTAKLASASGEERTTAFLTRPISSLTGIGAREAVSSDGIVKYPQRHVHSFVGGRTSHDGRPPWYPFTLRRSGHDCRRVLFGFRSSDQGALRRLLRRGRRILFW
jgi:hypothetical protein